MIFTPVTPSDKDKNQIPSIEGLNFSEELQTFNENLSKSFRNSLEKGEQNIEKSQKFDQPFLSSQLPLIPKLFSQYQFKLELESHIEMPVNKSKYFSFKLVLNPLGDCILPMSETVNLKVVILSQDGKKIIKNMKGGNILRGNYKQTMKFFPKENKHIAYFRIQITEVSCHFLGKSVSLKVLAKKSDFLRNQSWKIKSFSLKDLKVKAKDYRKKK
jgi:hypothetical protein